MPTVTVLLPGRDVLRIVDRLPPPPSPVTMLPPACTYVFPRVSVTEVTVDTASFQPTAITFRFPAVCASV